MSVLFSSTYGYFQQCQQNLLANMHALKNMNIQNLLAKNERKERIYMRMMGEQ